MRFTILTQYYPPEIGAPQNRLRSLARNILAAGHEVEVITAMPNYPGMRIHGGYRGRLFSEEDIDGIRVRRSWVYASNRKGTIPRLLNYFSFMFSCLFIGLGKGRSDYLVCESPPLFLGLSAVAIAMKKRSRLVFNVSDLWPESALKLGIVDEGIVLQAAYRLESWLYNKSFLVTGQTQGITRNIEKRFSKVATLWLPNGIDVDVVSNIEPDSAWRKAYGLEGKKVFMYAGILGHAQGLEVIIESAAGLADERDIAFVIVGDGPLANELRQKNHDLGGSVLFLPSVSKREIMNIIADAYACVVVLKKLDLFRGAIPSKIFDPLSVGVPILLGVEGEAKELFIDQARAGIAFEPENSRELMESVRSIARDGPMRDEMGKRGKAFVHECFDRRQIAQTLLERLQEH